jgi:hypothetical protein
MSKKLGRIRAILFSLTAVVPTLMFIMPVAFGIIGGGGSGGG